MTQHLTTAQSDRAAGVLLAMAAGDALGAGYEFGPPLADDVDVRMAGGGSFGWAPGEWTDDTSMAVAVAEVSAEGLDLRAPEAQNRIAERWIEWAADASDVGAQTRQVLSAASRGGTGSISDRMRAAASALHERTSRSGGNGSLMRTAPVALAYLDDPDALVEAATAISALTHFDSEAGEACALWCLAIRHAVLEGTLDGLRIALGRLPGHRRAVWSYRLDVAEELPPSAFDRNGWVGEALQGAWSAITRTPVPEEVGSSHPANHLRLALDAAVRGGQDTDTVAAIAGGLLGARWGASAVPSSWRRILHGWPGLRGRDLVKLAVLTARHGHPDHAGWPSGQFVDYSTYESSALVRHPDDEGVWLAGVGALDELPSGVDAVVSLCRLGADQVPAAGLRLQDHVEFWLVDSAEPAQNPNLGFVLRDAVDAVASLRTEGRSVLLHCVQAQSRTPTVAALYGAQITGRPAAECLVEVQRVLPGAHPNPAFFEVLQRSRTAAALTDADAGTVRIKGSADQDRAITLTADEADQMLVILNDLAVTLDRIGSREASGEDPEHTWVHEYFTTGGATLRLAHARYVLLVAIDRVYTEDEQAAMWDERPWPSWGEHLPDIGRWTDDS